MGNSHVGFYKVPRHGDKPKRSDDDSVRYSNGSSTGGSRNHGQLDLALIASLKKNSKCRNELSIGKSSCNLGRCHEIIDGIMSRAQQRNCGGPCPTSPKFGDIPTSDEIIRENLGPFQNFGSSDSNCPTQPRTRGYGSYGGKFDNNWNRTDIGMRKYSGLTNSILPGGCPTFGGLPSSDDIINTNLRNFGNFPGSDGSTTLTNPGEVGTKDFCAGFFGPGGSCGVGNGTSICGISVGITPEAQKYETPTIATQFEFGGGASFDIPVDADARPMDIFKSRPPEGSDETTSRTETMPGSAAGTIPNSATGTAPKPTSVAQLISQFEPQQSADETKEFQEFAQEPGPNLTPKSRPVATVPPQPTENAGTGPVQTKQHTDDTSKENDAFKHGPGLQRNQNDKPRKQSADGETGYSTRTGRSIDNGHPIGDDFQVPARNPGPLFLLKTEFDTFLKRYNVDGRPAWDSSTQPESDSSSRRPRPRPYMDVFPGSNSPVRHSSPTPSACRVPAIAPPPPQPRCVVNPAPPRTRSCFRPVSRNNNSRGNF